MQPPASVRAAGSFSSNSFSIPAVRLSLNAVRGASEGVSTPRPTRVRRSENRSLGRIKQIGWRALAPVAPAAVEVTAPSQFAADHCRNGRHCRSGGGSAPILGTSELHLQDSGSGALAVVRSESQRRNRRVDNDSVAAPAAATRKVETCLRGHGERLPSRHRNTRRLSPARFAVRNSGIQGSDAIGKCGCSGAGSRNGRFADSEEEGKPARSGRLNCNVRGSGYRTSRARQSGTP